MADGVGGVAVVGDLEGADDAVVVDDGVGAEAEDAVEGEQAAGGGLGGAAVVALDAAEAVGGEEPAAIAGVEGGDGVAAAAEEGGEGGAAAEELDELAAGDVDADAVALAAGGAAAAVVAKPPIRPREVHVLHRGASMRPLAKWHQARRGQSSSSPVLPRRSMPAARASSRWMRATRSTWPLAGKRS